MLADGYRIYGYGAIDCKVMVADIMSPDAAHQVQVMGYYGWAQGYISRRESEEMQATGSDFDPSPQALNAEEQIKFLADFCANNGDSSVSDAADALFERLRAMGAVHGDRK